MPIQISVEQRGDGIRTITRRLSDSNINRASQYAINRGISKANTEYKRGISRFYKIKQADIKNDVRQKKASNSNLEGSISASIKPISLSRFNPSFTNNGRTLSIKSIKNKETGKRGLEQLSKKASNKKQDGGVSFEIQKGKKKNLPFAFLVNSETPGVSKQIWARGKYIGNKFNRSKSRFPIEALKTLSPFGAMTKEDISEAVQKEATETMQKEFERQVNRFLNNS